MQNKAHPISSGSTPKTQFPNNKYQLNSRAAFFTWKTNNEQHISIHTTIPRLSTATHGHDSNFIVSFDILNVCLLYLHITKKKHTVRPELKNKARQQQRRRR